MESTTPSSPTPTSPLTVMSLAAAFATIPDPRREAGTTYPPDREAGTRRTGVAIDGKARRGRLQFQDHGSPVHALSAFCQDANLVLAYEPIKQGREKAEAELTVAPEPHCFRLAPLRPAP